MLVSEEFGAGSVVFGVDRVDAALDRRFAIAGEVADGLAGLGLEGFEAVPEIDGGADLHDATSFSERTKDPGVNVFLQASYCFGDPVKGGVGRHVAAPVTKDAEGQHCLVSPEAGGAMIRLAIRVGPDTVDGGPDPANPSGQVDIRGHLEFHFSLEGCDDLFSGMVDLVIDRCSLVGRGVATLLEEALQGRGADAHQLDAEVSTAVEIGIELPGQVVDNLPQVLAHILEVGELDRDRDGVDRLVGPDSLLGAQGNVGGALGERGNLVITEVDIAFRKEDEGVFASHHDIGGAFH